MWIHWPFFSKTWTKGHWPLDDLWPQSVEITCVTLPKDQCIQVPWQYINVCGYSDQFCKIPHTYTYIHILHAYTYYIHTTYYVQNEWSHSLLLNSVQARQKLLPTIRPVARIDFGGVRHPQKSEPFGPKKWTFWTSPPLPSYKNLIFGPFCG